MSRKLIACLLLAFSTWVGNAFAADLKIATFNTESDPEFTTSPVNVAKTITKIGSFDILAVQEVESEEALKLYASAAAHAQKGEWRYVISESGFNATREPDFLGIVYRSNTFRQLATEEIHSIRSQPGSGDYGKPDWSLRGALVLRLQHIPTGKVFQVVTVHLKCCNEPAIRAHQTKILAAELKASPIPSIVLGDTNIPIEPGATAPAGDHVEAFNNLTSISGLDWVKPSNPVKTQCSPTFNSMLDQVFAPVGHNGAVEIKFPEPSYCDQDEEGFSDHRPVIAVLPNFLTATTTTSAQPDQPIPTAAEAQMEREAEEEAREFEAQQIARPNAFVE